MPQIIVACDGASIPREFRGGDWTQLQLVSNGPAGNLNIRVPSLASKLGGVVPPSAVDLVRIAAFAYWADQMARRRAEIDIFGQKWQRRFVIAMPVFGLSTWERPEVQKALSRALNYGTDDLWEFRFESRSPTGQGYLLEADWDAAERPESVLMFSGGTDSLCAAVEEAELGRRPLLISHSPSPRSESRQQRLLKSLPSGPSGWTFERLPVEVSKAGVDEKERTQRTRGFLYSSLGSAVAASFHISDVVLADNGFVSIGLPLSGQTVGAKMSRTTHPRFQYLFNSLLALILPSVRIRNPLLFRTRAECIGILKRSGLADRLRETHSCAASGRLASAADHCGVCSQCLDRRIGILAAGCSQWDVQYVTDIFNDGLAAPALMMAESYARLMRRLVEMSPEVLLNAYDELIDCATTDADGSPNAIERLAEMAIRQAETFHAVVRDVAATRLDSIVSGTYSRSSLLGLALTPKEPRKREGWHLPLAEEVVLTDSEAKEAERQNFKAAVPIIITGEVVPRTSNVVEIGGRRVTLPDADFRLFLRLVVQLFIGGDGYCRKGGGRQAGGLVGEGVVPDDVDNAVSRLRRSLQLGFLELAPKDYIEVQRGHGVRLSTHRRYVKVDRDALARHNNPAIRELAARLPML